jgi:hypothetical protein
MYLCSMIYIYTCNCQEVFINMKYYINAIKEISMLVIGIVFLLCMISVCVMTKGLVVYIFYKIGAGTMSLFG